MNRKIVLKVFVSILLLSTMFEMGFIKTVSASTTRIDGWVAVTIVGDVNGDGVVNILDVKKVKLAYSGVIEEPMADIDGNGVIDILDVKEIKFIYSDIPARIYFDGYIYNPPEEVFWGQNLSVPIGIKVIDYDVNHNSLKVNISSSIDSKEVTLTKDSPGVFYGVVLAVGIGMVGEPISNISIFNVRYGDEIVAEYFDISSGMNVTASALFVFPQYVLKGEHRLDARWKAWEYFDSDGVPLVNYGGSIGLQYNTVTISEYALRHYREYLNTGNLTFSETFLVQANWLVENAKQKGNYSVWEYNFDWPSYGCTDPWVSAMAQGEALSVLVRAYVLTGNTSYIDVGDMAIGSFEVEMSAGGVRYTDSSGVWFEECADVGIASSKVLNGFIYALLGIYEYSFETNNSRGWTLFWEGTDTLSNNIYRYDTGSWSYYDLLHYNEATLSYHNIHIRQLSTMYKLTDDETFLDYSNKFQSYIT